MGSPAALVAPAVDSTSSNGNAAIVTASAQTSFDCGPFRTMSTPLDVAPATATMGVPAAFGSSGGSFADSFAPFQNSGGPGNVTGVLNGPTLEPPVKPG